MCVVSPPSLTRSLTCTILAETMKRPYEKTPGSYVERRLYSLVRARPGRSYYYYYNKSPVAVSFFCKRRRRRLPVSTRRGILLFFIFGSSEFLSLSFSRRTATYARVCGMLVCVCVCVHCAKRAHLYLSVIDT